MKRIFLLSAFIMLNAMMTSCTADDAVSDNTITEHADGVGGQGGTIQPPPPPPKPGG